MPIALPPEVPAYIRYDNTVSNHVAVQGGTNWDFSRSAVTTPIAALPDPVPVIVAAALVTAPAYQGNPELPRNPPGLAVRFGYGSVVVPTNMQKLLNAMDPKTAYLVAGYADPKEPRNEVLAEKRAEAVASFLRKKGARTLTVRHFGGQYPRADVGSSENQRVELFPR